jgi:type II secretory pathway predicted ATPase ExeA
MFEQYFGLKRRLFRGGGGLDAGPLPPREALAQDVLDVLRQREGLAVVIGGCGLGKSFLGRWLTAQLREDHATAWVAHTQVDSPAELLQAVLFDLGLPTAAGSIQELRNTLTEALLNEAQHDRATVVVVDDAHHLSPRLLEELRLLGHLEGENGRVLNWVLLGLPGLADTLRHPTLRSLRHQAAAWATLHPLSPEESRNWLTREIRAAGGQPTQMLTSEAIDLLVEQGQGNPGRLVRLARRAFQLTVAGEMERVDAEAVLTAGEELPHDDGDSRGLSTETAAETSWSMTA